MPTHFLALSSRQRRRIAAAARAAYPEECCGILLGRREQEGEVRVERVMPAANESTADRRHSFEIGPARLVQAGDRARALGLAIVGFYHSHPDGAERPSGRDHREAWPDMSYLIVPRDRIMTSWRRGTDGELTAEALIEHRMIEQPVVERRVSERPMSERMPGVLGE